MDFLWFDMTKGNNCKQRVINNYSFIFVCKGKGKLFTSKKRYYLKQNDMFVLFPGTLHAYYSDKQEPWQLAWFGVVENGMEDILNKACISANDPVKLSVKKPEIKHGFLRIVELLKNRSDETECFAAAKVYELLGQLIVDTQNKTRQDINIGTMIKSATDFLVLNYNQSVTGTDIASYFGYSRTHFAYLFKTFTGQSVNEYLVSLRIAKAMELLKYTQLTVEVVANSVGFSNPYYFSKTFKRRNGVSPSVYRLTYQK